MGVCLVVASMLGIDLARRAEGDRARARVWLIPLLLLAHGSMAIQRLDALVALLFVLVARAAIARRPIQLGIWMGLAAATKLVPVLLVPVVLAADWPFWRDRARLGRVLGAFGLALAAGLLPMAILSLDSLVELLRYHGQRGLHCESVVGTVWGIARKLAGSPDIAGPSFSFGSMNFHSAASGALGKITMPLTLVLVGVVVHRLIKTAPEEKEGDRTRRVLCAMLAGTAALWIGGKVFSPQYLTWAIPLVVAMPGRLGKRLTWILLAGLLLGQLFFRGYYDYVYEQRALGLATLALRQVVVIAGMVLALRGAAGVVKDQAWTAAKSPP
jgi:hypothetical protein